MQRRFDGPRYIGDDFILGPIVHSSQLWLISFLRIEGEKRTHPRFADWPIVSFLYIISPNPLWDSKPELFSDIACLRIPYQPCIVLLGKLFSGSPVSNRRELRLHLNVVPTGAGVFKSRHILLHKYVNRIMITYLWRQIQLIIPSRRFRSIEWCHFDLFWMYVTWSLFSRITWYSLFHTSDLSVLKHSFLFTRGTSSVNSCSVYIQINFNTFALAKKIFHLK